MAKFQSEIVGYVNRSLPTIMDVTVQSSTTRSKFFKSSADEKFMTRDERFAEFEKKPKKVYLRETTQSLEDSVSGLCIVQIGSYPYTFEIYVNPDTKLRCENVAMFSQKRITKGMETIYASKTYWLEMGKVHELLTSESCLIFAECDKVAKFIAMKRGMNIQFLGDKMIDFGKGNHPYRVFIIDQDFLIMSLLNGAVFKTSVNDMPEMKPLKDRFYIKEVLFEKEVGKDDWKRF